MPSELAFSLYRPQVFIWLVSGIATMVQPLDMYGFWRSQATFRVRVALHWKGIAYREIPINLDRGGQDVDAFRAINPFGGVPALMIDGHALTQSLAILEYLEETHPETPLLPTHPLGRARVRALAALAVSDSHPLIVPRVKRWLTAHVGLTPEQWTAWQTQWFGSGLLAYEANLGHAATGLYCHGDAPSFADICLCGLAAGAKTFGVSIADIPRVERIVAQCLTLPAFVASRAEAQADYPG